MTFPVASGPVFAEGAGKAALKVLLALAALVGALLLVWYFITGPQRARVDAKVAGATAETAKAGQKAGQDALQITGKVQDAHVRIDLVTQGNANAIRNAPGASAVVDPALAGAGLRALCLRDAYRLQPSCQ